MEALTLEAATEKALLDSLVKRIETLNLSLRSTNALQNAGVEFVWELARLTDAELLKTKGFGRKSFLEIKDEALPELGLTLNMRFDENVCEEIRERCGRGPTPPEETASEEPVDETVDPRALKPSELILIAPGLLKARVRRLNQESDLLRGLLGALEAGLTVVPNDSTPDSVRSFLAEAGDGLSDALVRERRKILSEEISSLTQALSGGWTGAAILRQVSAALKLLEES